MGGASFGSIQQGDPNFPPEGPDTPLDYRYENPYNFCCSLGHAAKTIAVFNLFYLVMELVDMIAAWEAAPITMAVNSLYSFTFQDMSVFYVCMAWREGTAFMSFILLMIFFTVTKFGYFIATIGFMVAAFGCHSTKIDLLCSKIFMWTSFFYAGLLLLLRLILALLNDGCKFWWGKYLMFAIGISAFTLFNGYVARAFRNMVQRRILLELPAEPQEVVGVVASTTPKEESVPNQEVVGGDAPKTEGP